MDKKLYFLKGELYFYLEKQEQFLQKDTRPYLQIVELENKYYAIPLRSELNKHNADLQLPVICTHEKKGYLDFSKSFQVITPNFFYAKEEYREIVLLDDNKVIELLKLTNKLKSQNKLRFAINDFEFLNLQRNMFLKPYLESLGLSTTGRDKFSCLDKKHDDKTPSMSYNPRNNTVHCFSCGKTYNFINLIRNTYDLDYKQAVKYIDELIKNNFYNVDLNSVIANQLNSEIDNVSKEQLGYIKNKIEVSANNIRQTDYLLKRGISYETCEKLNVGYDLKYNQLILPISKHHDYFIRRNIDDNAELRYIYMKNRRIPVTYPCSTNGNNKDNTLFICEGYIDMLSLVEVGEYALSLNGANNINNAKELLSYFKEKNIVIALDNDEAGRNATERLENILKEQGSHYRILNLGTYNDVNECLVKDKNLLLSEIANVKNSFNINQIIEKERSIEMNNKNLIKLEYITDGTLELMQDSGVIFNVSDMGNEMNYVEMSSEDYSKYCDYLEGIKINNKQELER